ncbi:unnamed protein product, partial [Ixodes hexagonus]
EVFLCYWASWSHYRVGNGSFSVQQIDPSPCTHLIYAYAKLENGVIAPFDPFLDTQTHERVRCYFTSNLQARKFFQLISDAFANRGAAHLGRTVSTGLGRLTHQIGVRSALASFLLSGYDIKKYILVCYQRHRGGSVPNKQNGLLQDLRKALDRKNYILTAAVSGLKQTIDAAYDVPELSKHVHFLSIIGFDLFGPWKGSTGHPAPLRAQGHEDSGADNTLNVASCIENWISKGADERKLVLGMPLYGRSYTLVDPDKHDFMAPISGAGLPGPITKEPGMLGYDEICTLLSSGGWSKSRDPNANAPVIIKGNQWIGYDDAESLAAKVSLG